MLKIHNGLEKEIKKTQDLVNLYIRLKYTLKIHNGGLLAKCYTCGKVWPLETSQDWKNYHAGHYWKADKRSGHQAVRFDLDNIRPQCSQCNTFRGGMMSEFAFNLIREIGEQKFTELGIRAKQPKKWSINELQSLQRDINLLFLNDELQEKLKIYKDVKNS